ncbi:alpha/beta hydrolase fold domain-containing protein [Actinomycetospora soli]|uniref:alpha/beta hydrolase fold domain-containing protein n=1 Tax=Actinomycetospora soli TaxID=2893887 RepID=UPI001E2E6CF5|nr:alpha/beta hydrolase fold domain-containing protein [Actinomycetospora soli]MCD2188091.1 alpha/beta hydrolase fold domain-containing protein [Actinomycetospora soli]
MAMRVRTAAVRRATRMMAPLLARRTPVPLQRFGMTAALAAIGKPGDARVSPITLGGVRGERVRPADADPATVVLYLHGGGYVTGAARDFRAPAAVLADRLGAVVITLDYRKAPQSRHPGALDDAEAAYHALLSSGFSAERVALVGDSAGGGLALSLAMRVRDAGDPPPAVVGLICPWVDLRPDIAGNRPDSPADPLLRSSSLARWAAMYASGNAHDPSLSPVLGDLSGLPPLVVHSASDDPLASDADQLVARAHECGAPIVHQRYAGLWHDFHLMPGLHPAASSALGDLAASLARHLPPEASARPRVAVIGAGMSGLCMGAKLRGAGLHDFTIYEKADEVGGTWRDNTYPGLSCDVPSRFYSYSFAPNPGWSHVFPEGAEVQSYFRRSADHLGLRPHVRFGAEVVEASWVDGRWHLRVADGTTDVVDVLVTATGVLHHPSVPDIEGLDSFRGASFHSARWDHSVPLDGRRVGLIGTGSTGTQILSALSTRVDRLTVFQRTAQWVLPIPNPAYSALSRGLLRRVPALSRLSHRTYQRLMEATFGRAVTTPGLVRSAVNAACRLSLRWGIRDAVLREKLTPPDEPMCKRLVMSPSFHRAVQRGAVDVVTDQIKRVVPDGVVTEDGTVHELDVLVLATGFDARAYVRPMAVHGCGGVTLDQQWEDGPSAYRTVAVPEFPNFFMIMGPHSPIGNHSLIAVAEEQAEYVLSWIDTLRREGIAAVSPTERATRDYNRSIREEMPRTVWSTGCASWYLGPDGVPELWPWSPAAHRSMMRTPVPEDFVVVDEAGRSQSPTI